MALGPAWACYQLRIRGQSHGQPQLVVVEIQGVGDPNLGVSEAMGTPRYYPFLRCSMKSSAKLWGYPIYEIEYPRI